MQIKTLIKDQTFILRELPVTTGIYTQISASTAVSAPAPPPSFYSKTQCDIKPLLCIIAGKWHILQLQGAPAFLENVLKFLLGHLRQGKYWGYWARGTAERCLQIELPSWFPAPQTSLQSSSPWHYPAAPSKTLLHKTPMCQLFDRLCRAHSDRTVFCIHTTLSFPAKEIRKLKRFVLQQAKLPREQNQKNGKHYQSLFYKYLFGGMQGSCIKALRSALTQAGMEMEPG